MTDSPSRAVTWLRRLPLAIGALALLVMMGITVADIVMRNFFNRPIQGTYEIVQLGLATSIYAGMAETFLRGAHLVVDIIDQYAPRLSHRILQPCGTALSLILLVGLTWGAIEQMRVVALYGDRTMDLGLPVTWLWIPIVIGLLAATLTVAYILVRDFRRAPE